MDELKQWIMNSLPPSGEWWGDGYLEFIDSAEKMLKHGIDTDTIKEILSDLFNAMTAEYGD